jgi:hypothetical protein
MIAMRISGLPLLAQPLAHQAGVGLEEEVRKRTRE